MENSFPRGSGILLPVTSLPSPYGIGTFGKSAYNFVNFLQSAKQKYWQVLPIGPTGYGDSPYQSFSTFAINPYFIDLTELTRGGYLTKAEIDSAHLENDDKTKIDYGKQFACRLPLLKKAASRFLLSYEEEELSRFDAFTAENDFWLPDYALFMVLKEKNGNVAFTKWDKKLRSRDEETLAAARQQYNEEIRQWEVLQYWCQSQWFRLKKYANKAGISIIGDIPIYVSPDSSDLWTHPELFQTDEDMALTSVAGCPPDAFSADGQLWGNPLYNWEYHKETEYRWWISRLSATGKLFDVVRIDHFRGFAGYYSIPAGSKTAAGGEWKTGPGADFVRSIKAALPDIKVIAEDLGYLTDDVRALLRESGFPGMKVLQFAFDSREQSDYLPHTYPRQCVVYTGTHDNTTSDDWKISAPPDDVLYAMDYLGCTPEVFTSTFVRTALASVADTAVIPMQDWLELGAEARINTPSTLGKNWLWRMEEKDPSPKLAEKIAHLTTLYGR